MSKTVVFTDGGQVLWSRESPAASEIPGRVVNEFVAQTFIEATGPPASGAANTATVAGHVVKFVRSRELGVTTAVLTPAIAASRTAEQAATDVARIYASTNPKGAARDLESFSRLAELRLSELEGGANAAFGGDDADAGAGAAGDLSSVTGALDGLNLDPAAAAGAADADEAAPNPFERVPRAAKAKAAAALAANSKKAAAKKAPKKQNRRWDGLDGDDGPLDFSEAGEAGEAGAAGAAGAGAAAGAAVAPLALEGYGARSRNGFEIAALSDELNGILGAEPAAATAPKESFGFLRGLVGGKTITDKDLDKALGAMRDHLVGKNVAPDAAEFLVGEVRRDLVGAKTESWTSVSATVRASTVKALRAILTPKTSVEILLEVQQRRKLRNARPYAISVVGVNGVGKSTNLGKIGFWLLQNDLRVLVAACDTFRSGAVEQLKVHVDRLAQLTARQGAGHVELFAQGYGKDAAVVAQKAVEHAQRHGFDVVLMDTAGRRHNDERLMSSLEKFGQLAQPDKIIMVGEALVGTDSVQQARNFDAALGPRRHLDFFLVSKVDTVGDMLGTLVNMTYSTGVPVLFVGVGQNYTDLRTLSVEWAVNKLLA